MRVSRRRERHRPDARIRHSRPLSHCNTLLTQRHYSARVVGGEQEAVLCKRTNRLNLRLCARDRTNTRAATRATSIACKRRKETLQIRRPFLVNKSQTFTRLLQFSYDSFTLNVTDFCVFFGSNVNTYKASQYSYFQNVLKSRLRPTTVASSKNQTIELVSNEIGYFLSKP